MRAIIILGLIFTAWEGILTHFFPARSQDYYQKAAQKWSTGIGPALIGWMDMLSIVGLIVVGILSFFFLPIIQAIMFCAAMFAVIMIGGAVSGKVVSRRLKG